jgi:hypothetical protein
MMRHRARVRRGAFQVIAVFAAASSAAVLTAASVAAPATASRISERASHAASAAAPTWQPPLSIPGVDTTGGGGNGNVWSGAAACTGTGYCAVLGSYDVLPLTGSSRYVFAWSKTNGVWQSAAVPLSGLGPQNQGNAYALSCPSAGNCAGGGYYMLRGQNWDAEPFVVDESRGAWGKAEPVRGIAAVNTGHNAVVSVVSCGAPGYCTAAGTYQDTQLHQFGFLVNEVKGRWGVAHAVPGLAALGGAGRVTGVSCWSAGNCAVVGTASGKAFVLSERRGFWGKIVRVAGTTAGPAVLRTVSCDRLGDCVAGGRYTPKAHGTGQAFVVTEEGGRWGAAHALAGYGTKSGQVLSISCLAAGYCAAAGGSFTVDEIRGSWRQAVRVPASYSLVSVSCAGPGSCVADGYYTITVNGPTRESGAVAADTGGTWSGYEELPGESVLDHANTSATVSPVSCGTTAGNCAIWGSWLDQYGPYNEWVSVTA